MTDQPERRKGGKEREEDAGDRPDPQFDPRDPRPISSKFVHVSGELLQTNTWKTLYDLPSSYYTPKIKEFGLEIK